MPKPEAESTELARITGPAAQLIEQIKKDPTKVPDEKLVPLYVALTTIKKQIDDLLSKHARAEMLKRRERGTVAGEQNQHREFIFGKYKLTIQSKQSWPIIVQKMLALLKSKKALDDGTNIIVTAGEHVADFRKFLKLHEKELKQMGVEIDTKIDDKKVEGLLATKKISQKEFEECLDKKPPTYALIAEQVDESTLVKEIH